MICKKCIRGRHDKCKGCTCQHRVATSATKALKLVFLSSHRPERTFARTTEDLPLVPLKSHQKDGRSLRGMEKESTGKGRENPSLTFSSDVPLASTLRVKPICTHSNCWISYCEWVLIILRPSMLVSRSPTMPIWCCDPYTKARLDVFTKTVASISTDQGSENTTSNSDHRNGSL